MIFFKNQHLLPLLWFVVALIPLFMGEYVLRRKQKILFSGNLLPADPVGKDQLRRSLYLFSAALFILAALLRPSWNPTVRIVEKKGRDVVFLLDVSRSMSAGDVAPSRLERAKLEISETVQSIEGDRVGLVVFAGNSVVKCPLTLDYGFFSFALKDVTVNSVSRGGTQLGDALRMVESQVLDDQTREERDIILITDGEDQDSYPVEAAKALGSQGVRLIVIGLGDDIQGARLQDSQGNFLTYDGKEVWSKMDGETLRLMAAATPGGSYVPAGQANFSLPRIYRSLISENSRQSTGEEETLVYEEKFQFFIALSLILLLLEAFRIIGPVERKNLFPFLSGSRTGLYLILILVSFSLPSRLAAEGRADLYQKGEKALEANNWDSYSQIYDKLTDKGVSDGKIAYNRGRSQYKQEDYAGAAGSFGEAASDLEGKKAARALFNRGNALMKQAEAYQETAGESLAQARQAYEKALELNPAYKEAARNLELLLNQQQKQQNDQQQKDDKQSDKSEGNDSSGDGQNGSSDEQQQGDQGKPQQTQPGQDEESDSRAQDILNQEEDNRDKRESAFVTGGGIYQVEKDW